MSSALKDARWQLASEHAASEGIDFYSADYWVKELYLGVAQDTLMMADRSEIERLASRFRSGE